jgi:predicted transposase YbfD/YdcC
VVCPDSEAAVDRQPETNSLLHQFAALNDPRQLVKVVYPLPEILLLVLCASIAAADDFVEVEHWGNTHLDFLRRFLPYKDGIPSHDALNDLMNALDHKLFSECFVAWVNGLRDSDLEVVAVDGKTSRRTHARSKGRQALHMVSAWASGQRLVLGQEATEEKSNEITAIPRLLQRLELKGALVTIDAMGCQTKIAATILERGADYLLAVKDNQPTLHDDIKRYFDDAPAAELQTIQTTDGDHGRIEVRRHVVSHKVDWLAGDSRFPGIKSIAMVENTVERNGETSCERRYYICSLALLATLVADALRSHWHIENRLHWVLDVIFREDLSRLRTGNGPQNMATVRHMVMNLLRSAKPGKSLKVRRKLAAWDPHYLHAILLGTG